MSAIVDVRFKYSESRQELEAGAIGAAPMFSDIPGLLWKIWLVDENSQISGGIYKFSSRAAAEKYAASDLIAHLQEQRGELSIRIYDTLDSAGELTSAP